MKANLKLDSFEISVSDFVVTIDPKNGSTTCSFSVDLLEDLIDTLILLRRLKERGY